MVAKPVAKPFIQPVWFSERERRASAATAERGMSDLFVRAHARACVCLFCEVHVWACGGVCGTNTMGTRTPCVRGLCGRGALDARDIFGCHRGRMLSARARPTYLCISGVAQRVRLVAATLWSGVAVKGMRHFHQFMEQPLWWTYTLSPVLCCFRRSWSVVRTRITGNTYAFMHPFTWFI